MKKQLLVLTLGLGFAGLLTMGAGCSKAQTGKTPTTNATQNAQYTADDQVESADTADAAQVTELGEPSGDQEEDAAAVKEVLGEMDAANTQAEDAVSDVENGEDVDSYTLTTEIPE